jgi:hypothetical protein
LIESAVLVRVGGDVGAADVVAEGPNGLQRDAAAARASIFVFVLFFVDGQAMGSSSLSTSRLWVG